MSDGDNGSSGFQTGSDIGPHSFAPAEMITCDECLRANPPTRTNCLYCGAVLPATGLPASKGATNPQPPTQPVAGNVQTASVKSGFYVVLAPVESQVLCESSLTEAATVLDLKTAEAQIALNSGRPVPLARAETIEQATTIADRLLPQGIGVEIFREDTLNLDLPVTRIRALEFTDEGLVATPLRGERISIKWDDLILIVSGRWLVKRVVVEERRRRSSAKPLDSRELFSDEPLMDLYASSNDLGVRVYANSFDFSCLGTEKSITAAENFTNLLNLLGRRALKVEVDNTYRGVQAVLGTVWPLEPQTNKGAWRRSGVGKVDVSTVTTLDNERQFNSYSRLRQYVKLRDLETTDEEKAAG
ncbi:MAG: hypothetical protein QOG23_3118 [Blastocatellia bacterium]|nr:hypothetical protein [Blastocatellia bacterium]